MTAEYRRHLALLVFCALMVLAAGVGLRDPWPADEPRFALIAKDMLENGNWLFPEVGGVLYPDKPPLFFWLVAGVYWLTGSLRVAFLLPGLAAGIGTLILVTDLARRLWDERTALWCGATLLALVQFPLQMKSGQIDAVLCFFTTLGLYGFCRHLLLGPDWRWYAIGGLAAGLGVITKGVGFLPYLVLIPYAVAARRGWPVATTNWRDGRWLLAPAASLAVIGAWLLPMLAIALTSTDPGLTGYRDDILFHQTVTRYADSWGHIKPPWYLLTNAVPWLWLPVSFLLPWLVPAWRNDLKARSAPVLLLAGWILLVLVFFSISSGKRSLYIFPAAPALALIAGLHASRLVAHAPVRRVLLAVPAVVGTCLVGAAAWLLGQPAAAAARLTDVGALEPLAAAAFLVGATMLVLLATRSQSKSPWGFAAAMAAFWIGTGLFIAPALDSTRSGRALMVRVAENLEPGEELGYVLCPEQFLLQRPGPITHFGFRRGDPDAEVADALRWAAASANRRLLMPGRSLPDCVDRDSAALVGRAHRRDWYLVAGGDLEDACVRGLPADPVLVLAYPQSQGSGTAGPDWTGPTLGGHAPRPAVPGID